ncbi:MAG: lysophospholipid acyltransferase family protein [Paracoccaceae bacterium]|jgi:putative hemolysin
MERTQEQTRPSDAPLPLDVQPYDKRKLSYANTFENPLQRITIQTIELLTARLRILRRIRKFEAQGVPFGQPFWKQALDTMGIKLLTPEEQIARIPKDGPIVVTSNHPHGLVDGMILGELIGQVRTDYKILTRSLLTGVAEIDQFMIPVPFPHEPDALEKNLWMRKQAMDHLKNGGIVAVFPSGSVAASQTMFGPVIEREWNPFTSKMIQRSNAEVLPIFFPGSNSRLYQIANQISATLRQGLLLYEIAHAFNKPQSPVIGHVISRDKISKWSDNPRGFMSWLREETLRLRTHPNG